MHSLNLVSLILLVTHCLTLTQSAPVGSSLGNVTFEKFCPNAIAFNYLYNKYELQVPLSLSSEAAKLHVTKLAAVADADLSSSVSGLKVAAHTLKSNTAVLSLLCTSFQRCKTLRNELIANPSLLQRAVSFRASGSLNSTQVTSVPVEGVLSSASIISPKCNKGWVVFQRRVDGSLSFYQNYQTYARGFGDVKGNYWMGLDNINAATATGARSPYCQLKVVVRTIAGRRYVGIWNNFQVEEAARGYRFVAYSPDSSNTMPSDSISVMSGQRFTTYDQDQDSYWFTNCATYYGYGGWWFKSCHHTYLNGLYPDKHILNKYEYSSIKIGNVWQPVYYSSMSYRCQQA